jgi:hypothetical protein
MKHPDIFANDSTGIDPQEKLISWSTLEFEMI